VHGANQEMVKPGNVSGIGTIELLNSIFGSSHGCAKDRINILPKSL
jgi:hypothetical protein